MLHQKRICDAVARLRIDHKLDLLAGFLQFVNELDGVGQVHVVIDRTVDQKQFAVQVFRGIDW